ncbi:MAG: hypothetical protein Q4A31_05405 [Corynebacterium sp.]|uniref:hypothetical protein n=1 Tax=Corynebacterium sp. TaxID=1720 RepID=UPI0026DBF203|nr:hypothetical protein [Corynebacterium sp.]MDO4761335.1 hypothetical protein [Corynebacterium sp.]
MTNTIISRELLIWLTLLDPESGVKMGLEQASLFLHKPERRIYQLTSSVLHNLAFMVLLHDPHKESAAWDLLASGVTGLRKQYSNRSSLKSYLNEYLSNLGL